MKKIESRGTDLFLRELRLKREAVPTWTEYPFNLPVVVGLERLLISAPVTFLVGENGSGKSTLLEALAVAWGFNAEGGSKNFRFASRESHSKLWEFLTLVRGTRKPRGGFFLRAETLYNVATEIDRLGVEAGYGGQSLHECSHGEAFLALFLDRFHGSSFFVLDEPEAALSPSRQLAVLARLHDLVAEGSQFMIATHSPILLAYPGAQIYQCGDDGLSVVDYEQTDHYFLTQRFMNDRERMMGELFRDSPPADRNFEG